MKSLEEIKDYLQDKINEHRYSPHFHTVYNDQLFLSNCALLDAITYIEDVYQHSKLTDDSNRAYDALIQIRKTYTPL